MNLSAWPCGHVYHENCLKAWCRTSKSCPECKAKYRNNPIRLFYQPVVGEGEKLDGEITVLEEAGDGESDIGLRKQLQLRDNVIKDLQSYMTQLAAVAGEKQTQLESQLDEASETSRELMRQMFAAQELLNTSKLELVKQTRLVQQQRREIGGLQEELRVASVAAEAPAKYLKDFMEDDAYDSKDVCVDNRVRDLDASLSAAIVNIKAGGVTWENFIRQQHKMLSRRQEQNTELVKDNKRLLAEKEAQAKVIAMVRQSNKDLTERAQNLSQTLKTLKRSRAVMEDGAGAREVPPKRQAPIEGTPSVLSKPDTLRRMPSTMPHEEEETYEKTSNPFAMQKAKLTKPAEAQPSAAAARELPSASMQSAAPVPGYIPTSKQGLAVSGGLSAIVASKRVHANLQKALARSSFKTAAQRTTTGTVKQVSQSGSFFRRVG